MGSNPTPGANYEPAGINEKELIVNFFMYLRRQGYRDSTIAGRMSLFKILLRESRNIHEPESVKDVIASKDWSEGRKENAVYTYENFAEMKGITWKRPIYQRVERIPFIPLESEIDQIIAGISHRTGTFAQVVKETGARPGEVKELRWIDADPNNSTIRINNPEKNGKARVVRVSSQLIGRVLSLPRKGDRVFGKVKLRTIQRSYQRQRKRVAEKTRNPRLRKITFITMRHGKATMEYARTKDILHVKRLLGHKSINNTLRYTHLIDFKSDEWVCKIAESIEEAVELIESGFEYVTDFGDCKIFRKRK